MQLRNMTLTLPDGLVRQAKAYASEHGTSVSAIIRELLKAVTGWKPDKDEELDHLKAFSEGRIGKKKAIEALGLRDYAQLLLLLGERKLPLPRTPDHVLKVMSETIRSATGE